MSKAKSTKSDSARNTQVARILTVLDLFESAPHGLTVSEVLDRAAARGHSASKRTIYRDLEALAQAGFPLFPDGNADEQAQRWKLDRAARITDYLTLSPKELLGLYFARGVLVPLRDTPFYQDLESAFKKIEEKIGVRAREHLAEISSEIVFEPGPKWGLGLQPDTIDTVRACCTENQILEVTYDSVNRGTKSKRSLGCHYLYFSKGAMYLVAEDLADRKVKVFSVARMADAAMSDREYSGEKTNPETFFESSFGIFRDTAVESVQLTFRPPVAAFVRERCWHGSQRVVNRSDGSVEISLKLAITPELVQWILGFGANVRVLKPASLAERISSEAEAVVRTYTRKEAA